MACFRAMSRVQCAPPSVARAAHGAASRAAGANRSVVAGARDSATRSFLTGGGAGAGGGAGGATAGARGAMRALAACVPSGPSGTKAQLAAARVLMHDDAMERALFGEGDDLEDT